MICTEPLSANYPSEADWLLPIVELAWRSADDPDFQLDHWQADLIRRILEVYPEGHERAGELRYRQVVCSMGRQNGKSVIGAILGLFGLLRAPGQLVIGIASSAEQARILYERTMHVIRSNPSLSARFDKLTETRGIRAKDGGKYEIKAARSGALQGLPLNVGLCDELHIMPSALWSDMVNGTAAKRNGLVVGITTAGDDNSELLKQLYEVGHKAIQGDKTLERFGFFLWESADAKVPDDDNELAEYLKQANPALEAGRLDIATVISDVRSMPEVDVIRYRLNRFVAASSTFITPTMWQACARPGDMSFPKDARPIFTIDQTPNHDYASIVATVKGEDGYTYTELVASIVKPQMGDLLNICNQLLQFSPMTFGMEGFALGGTLGKELRIRKFPVAILSSSDIVNASSMAYSLIAQKKIRHGDEPLLSIQFPRTVRKNVGESFRISRQDSSVEIDGVLATVMGIYLAQTRLEHSLQVF